MPSVWCGESWALRAGGHPLPGGQGIAYAGWTITAVSAPIAKDADMGHYRAEIGGGSHFPEQLFGDSSLTLRHEDTGLELHFDAVGALRQWLVDSVPPVQVPHARKWQQSREADMEANNVAALAYDWTYTTSYGGSCSRALPGEEPVSELFWEHTDKHIDKALLRKREPILFYADIPLYESELDDNGASQLNVKIRVMPSCWFVLLRFWLRVDGLLVRLRDTRIVCNLQEPSLRLVRERMHAEGTFEHLAKAGAPTNPATFKTADTTATALEAIAPIGCTLFETKVLQV